MTAVLFSYNAGDVLMVQPHNMPDTVSSFIDLFHLDPDALVTVNSAPPGESLSKHPLVSHCQVRALTL